MTASYDNTAGMIPGVIRDGATGALLRVDSNGAIAITVAGTKSIAAGAAATQKDWIPGTIRDPVSGTPMTVNADGSINVVTS